MRNKTRCMYCIWRQHSECACVFFGACSLSPLLSRNRARVRSDRGGDRQPPALRDRLGLVQIDRVQAVKGANVGIWRQRKVRGDRGRQRLRRGDRHAIPMRQLGCEMHRSTRTLDAGRRGRSRQAVVVESSPHMDRPAPLLIELLGQYLDRQQINSN